MNKEIKENKEDSKIEINVHGNVYLTTVNATENNYHDHYISDSRYDHKEEDDAIKKSWSRFYRANSL